MLTRGRHAIIRARERYGLDLDEMDLAHLEAQIRLGHSKLKRHSCGQRVHFNGKWRRDARQEHVVTAGGIRLRAVWSPLLDKIVTFLHPQQRFK